MALPRPLLWPFGAHSEVTKPSRYGPCVPCRGHRSRTSQRRTWPLVGHRSRVACTRAEVWGLDGSRVQGDFLLLCVTPAAFGLRRAQPNGNATAFPQLLEVLFCTLNTDTLCLSQLLRIHQQYLINYHRHLFTLTFMTLGGLHT